MNDVLLSLLRADVMTEVIQKLPEPETIIVDKLFNRDDRGKDSLSDIVAIEQLKTEQKILPFVEPTTEAPEAKKVAVGGVVIKLPFIKVKKFFVPSEIREISRLTGKRAAQVIKNELQDLKNRLKRTREVLAAKALTGKVVHKLYTGEAEIDVSIDYGDILTHTPSAKWDTDTGDPIRDLRAMKRKIKQNAKGYGAQLIVFMGYDAYDAALGSKKLQEWQKTKALEQIIKSKVPGIQEIVEVDGSFVDFDGSTKDFVDSKTVYMVALDAPLMEVWGPTETLEELDVEAIPRIVAKPVEHKTDPEGLEIIVQARVLPIVAEVKAICKAVVVS